MPTHIRAPAPVSAPPASWARMAGVLYLVIIVFAGFSEGYVRGTLVDPASAASTAASIRASEGLFRAAFVLDLTAFLADVALAVLFYLLLAPVSRALALVAGAFRMAQATILGLNMLHHLGAVLLLDGAGYVAAFEPDQLDALVLLSLDLHRHGYLISQMFFGVHCVLVGLLIWRAWYFPRTLGVLMGVAGLAYLADGLLFFLAPGHAAAASPFLLTPVVVAEVGLCLWLLVKGIRAAPPGGGAALPAAAV